MSPIFPKVNYVPPKYYLGAREINPQNVSEIDYPDSFWSHDDEGDYYGFHITSSETKLENKNLCSRIRSPDKIFYAGEFFDPIKNAKAKITKSDIRNFYEIRLVKLLEANDDKTVKVSDYFNLKYKGIALHWNKFIVGHTYLVAISYMDQKIFPFYDVDAQSTFVSNCRFIGDFS